MKSFILVISFSLICFACKKENKVTMLAQLEVEEFIDLTDDIPTLNYEELKPWLNKKDDKTYVVNFWATWCIPCVKELPYFENVNKDYNDKNVEVILVSLDFLRNKQDRLIPFVEKQNIQSKVLHLSDRNEQFWIADIAESWTGSIPATLIYNKEKRKFYEQTFSQEELETEIKLFLN
jgi:thiol-disulfide isomerase/thioredoxin